MDAHEPYLWSNPLQLSAEVPGITGVRSKRVLQCIDACPA